MSEREFTIATAQAETAAIEAERTRLIQDQAAEIEVLQAQAELLRRELAMALDRIGDLEDQRDVEENRG